MRTPQSDVPAEVITHYIVRDYQRMYNGFHAMREEKQALIDELLKKISKKTRAVSNLQAENKMLREQVKDMKASRDAVTKAVTEDLKEQLREADRKIALLAQAVTDPAKADSVFLQQCAVHTIETDDDKAWMNKAMKQLEKALLNFVSVESRLYEYGEFVKRAREQGYESKELDKATDKFTRAFGKIDACVSHIEDFFTKIGNIKIEDNG